MNWPGHYPRLKASDLRGVGGYPDPVPFERVTCPACGAGDGVLRIEGVEPVEPQTACCRRNGKQLNAWIPCWPFSGVVCAKCGEVTSTNGPVLEFIWQWFVWPFWRGQVVVRDPEGVLNE